MLQCVSLFFGSGRSRSQSPPPADSHKVGAHTPTHWDRIRKFFCFRHLRSSATPHPDSSNTIGVTSPLPSLKPAQGDSIAAHYDIPHPSVRPPSHSSQPVTSHVELNITQSLNPNQSIAPASIYHASPSSTADSDPGERQDLLLVPQVSLASVSKQALHSHTPTMSPRRHSPQLLDGNSYQYHAGQNVQMIQESNSVTVDGNKNHVNYTSTVVNHTSNFMEKLLDKTIQGAAFNSSARDPPPRCHPGTRLAVIAQCLEFVANATGNKKMLWVVGQAGVGKSAIMQNVVESPLPSVSQRASIFLSINGRNEGAKVVITLVYQLATKCQPYREFIELEIAREPSLLQSSISAQFNKFIIEPFVYHPQIKSIGRILIIIDGLDECDKPDTQRELLRLIADVCSAHPSLQVVWLIASRPEHQITSFFDQDDVQGVYEKEVIEVDSDEARSDVERFLRAETLRIQQEFSLSPRSQWPSEQDLWKLARASGGLFAYAQTAVRYIGDRDFADPISHLNDVLAVIDAHPLLRAPRGQHPMALLDALYARILSKVPERIMVNTRKILLVLVSETKKRRRSRKGGFLVLCNWLGMTCDEAYAAIRHLSSVLSAPKRDEAYKDNLRSFHKSFIDYISDFTRSGFSIDIECEAQQFEVQNTIRILEKAPGGIDCSDMDDSCDNGFTRFGYFVSVPGAGSDIVLNWSAGTDSNWSDNRTRLELYKWAFVNVIKGIRPGHSVFCTEFYIRLVIGQLRSSTQAHFQYWPLLDVVFEKSRRHAFTRSGILKRVPIEKLDFTYMKLYTRLRFCRSSGLTTKLSDPWNSSCKHLRKGNWSEDEGEDWTTDFSVTSHSGLISCPFCRERMVHQLKTWKTRFPNDDVTILFTSYQFSFVEFQFIDTDDGGSEWTYWIMLHIPKKKCRELGSEV